MSHKSYYVSKMNTYMYNIAFAVGHVAHLYGHGVNPISE